MGLQHNVIFPTKKSVAKNARKALSSLPLVDWMCWGGRPLPPSNPSTGPTSRSG